MEGGKGAAASVMEAAANVAASAKSGMEKTMAVVEEKVEKLKTSDPIEKDMATLRKEEKIMRAEQSKQEAYAQNAAASVGKSPSYTAAGTGDLVGPGAPHKLTDAHHSAVGLGQDGVVTEDLIGSHYAIGTAVGVVDPPDPNPNTVGTGARYPVGKGQETKSGEHITTVGGMYP